MNNISDIIICYQNKFLEDYKEINSKLYYFGKTGFPTRNFIREIVKEKDSLYEFLHQCNVLKTEVSCEKCGKGMRKIKDQSKKDKYIWICNKCSKKSIRTDSWFAYSKLNIEDIVLLTYELCIGTTSKELLFQYSFSSETLADWRHFYRELLVEYLETNSEKLGGVGVEVEIDESKFGKRKNNRGKNVKGAWVFGGIERNTGRTFLVQVHNRTRETLLGLIKEWIAPGSIILSDCWKSYECLGEEGFIHLSVNHKLFFKDPVTGVHTNTIESTWRHVKESLPKYNRKVRFEFYLAEYMFKTKCEAENSHSFVEFLKIISEVNWKELKIKVDKEKEEIQKSNSSTKRKKSNAKIVTDGDKIEERSKKRKNTKSKTKPLTTCINIDEPSTSTKSGPVTRSKARK